MSTRTVVLAGATAAGWLALLLAALASASTPLVAVLAGLLSLVCWHRAGRVASLATVVGCVALLASGTSMTAAALSGVLVLVHLVGVDLADDAHGAAAGAVLAALRPMLPGAVAGVVAAVLVAAAAALGSGAAAEVAVLALLSAPLLLLSAVLLALGQRTRSDRWVRQVNPRSLSAVTRRYLARARADADDLPG